MAADQMTGDGGADHPNRSRITDQVAAEPAAQSTPHFSRIWIRRLSVLACGVCLISALFVAPQWPQHVPRTLGEWRQPAPLHDFFQRIAVEESLQALLFFGLGCSLATSGRTLRGGRGGCILLCAASGLIGLVLLARGSDEWLWWHAVSASAFCFAGLWFGWGVRDGFIGIRRLALQWSLGVMALGVAVALLAASLLDANPSPFDAPRITSAEKRRIVSLVRLSPEERRGRTLTRRVRMNEHDLDVLVSWGLAARSQNGVKVDFDLTDETLQVELSKPVAVPLLGARHLNFHAEGRLRIIDGQTEFQLAGLRCGHCALPSFLVRQISDDIAELIRHDAELTRAANSLVSVRVKSGVLEIIGTERNLKSLPMLLSGSSERPELVRATREHVRHLLDMAERLPRGDERFRGLVRAAFQQARQRSAAGDAALENRAAIYALGMIFGHPDVERLVGRVMDEPTFWRAFVQLDGPTMHGRTDWVRHFCISAALTLASSETMSDAVGLLKEELDADDGGSGFSFGDLLADRAGTLFALAATRDAAAARIMQERLSGEFSLEELMPPAADLPEGLTDGELQTRFDGVGGRRFRLIERECQRRLANCSALR